MEKVPTKETLSERVCQCIRRDIITGHLKAGSTINIQHLCDRYETSETPIRLALNRLATENIVEHSPRQRVRVKELNINLCEETFDLRMLLECYCIPYVIMTLGTNESIRLRFQKNVVENLEVVQRLGPDDTIDDYLINYDYDMEFHQMLIKCAGNQLLVNLYEYLNPFLYVNYVFNKQSKERLLNGIQEHERLLRCLLEGDEEQARQALTTHLLNSKQVIISILKIDSIL